MKKILILNGPNLNMTGQREQKVYGTRTLDDINADLKLYAESMDMDAHFYQSNSEGAIIDALHAAHTDYDGVVINAGAYSHYSIAIADAIASISVPVVEVHLSNIAAREEFRHKSVISRSCAGCIVGFGEDSYKLGICALKLKFDRE